MPAPVFTSKTSEVHAKNIAETKDRARAYRAIHTGLVAHEGKPGGKRLVKSVLEALEAMGLPCDENAPHNWRVYHCKGGLSNEIQVLPPNRERHSVSFGWQQNTVTPEMIKNADQWAKGAEDYLVEQTAKTKELPALETEYRALLAKFLEAKKALNACKLPTVAQEAILNELHISRSSVW